MAVRNPASGTPGPRRTGVPGETFLRVQCRLTGRDLTLLGWLADHGVLTTDQIAHALFPSLDFAQRRLLTLIRAGLVDRFRPQRPEGGSYPYHYVLAQLGLDIVAAQRHDHDEWPTRDQARRRRWWLTNRANLPHLLAVNQFFTDLAGYARTHPGTVLERWWPSSRCRRQGTWQEASLRFDPRLHYATIAADGHGIWTTRNASDDETARVPFFVEVDLATEDLPRLVGKLEAYQSWSTITGRTWPILFWLTSTHRETHLHDRLRHHPTPIPVATAVHDPNGGLGTSPADPVWRLHHAARWLHQPRTGRLTLADLAVTVTDPHLDHRAPIA